MKLMGNHLILTFEQFNYKVIDLVKELARNWEDARWEIINKKNKFYESKLLKLNCDKALSLLQWKPTLDFQKTMQLTSDWYHSFIMKIISKFSKNVANKLLHFPISKNIQKLR